MINWKGKKVIVTGATGAVGKPLCSRLMDSGADVVVFSRDPDVAKTIVKADRYVAWTATDDGRWANEIDSSHAVVGLAGAPFFRKWTPEYRREAIESRVIGTRGLVNAMRNAAVRPRIFVSASSVGIYGYEGIDDRKIDENFPPGRDSWGQDSIQWELEAQKAQDELGIRTVVLRTGVVLSKKEGPMPWWVPTFKRYWGGPIAPGNQWIPWIHIEDEIGLIQFALENEKVSGPLNCTAPEPQISRDFFRTLGKVLKRPSWAPGQAYFMRKQFGEAAIVITHSKRVIPKKALDLGYKFKYSRAEEAFRDLIQ